MKQFTHVGPELLWRRDKQRETNNQSSEDSVDGATQQQQHQVLRNSGSEVHHWRELL
jgi:hypothetical protein